MLPVYSISKNNAVLPITRRHLQEKINGFGAYNQSAMGGILRTKYDRTSFGACPPFVRSTSVLRMKDDADKA